MPKSGTVFQVLARNLFYVLQASGEIIQLLEAEYTLPNGTRMEPADVFKAFYRAFWDVTFDGTEGRSVVSLNYCST